jgi:Tfp pilus assembly PilM family ATPase
LDVGAGRVKAVQLRRRRAGWRLEAAAAFARRRGGGRPRAEELAGWQAVLRRQGFAGRRCVLAVPDDALRCGILDVPPRSAGAPVGQIARMELCRMHGVRPEQMELSYWALPAPAGRSKEASQIMAVGCAHQAANALLDDVEQAGLAVVALDARMCAAARACAPLLASAPSATAVLDLGAEAADLLILCGQVVVYQRTVRDCGVRPLLERLCERLSLDAEAVACLLTEPAASDADGGAAAALPAEVARAVRRYAGRLAAELAEPFAYAAREYAAAGMKRLLLVGGGARLGALPDALREQVGIDTTVVAPSDLFECPRALVGKAADASLTLAAGLAMFQEG